MSLQDKSKQYLSEDDQEAGDAGSQAGEIEFVEFLGHVAETREDLLSPQEMKHLQVVHEGLHKEYVKKQKALRSERQAAKENKTVNRTTQGYGYTGGGEMSPYKPNPVLDCAQFSGATDSKVNPSAVINEATTNEEQRADAELQYKLQNQPRYMPKPGHTPPRLTR